MRLNAVVFDVDGTLVDSEQEGHRVAFNWAFEELGLDYHWDRDSYRALLGVPGGVARLRHYLKSQDVATPAADALASQLHLVKTARLDAMIAEGALTLRPGVAALLDDLRRAGVRLAVATTGSRGWVKPLLGSLTPGYFEVVVTGSEVDVVKPDPACYQLALAKLALGQSEVLAVEDSPPGCTAAVRAGLTCVVVTNADTATARFPGAALVVSGYGGPGEDEVVFDPLGVAPDLPLRACDLAAVAAAASHPGAPSMVPVS